MDDLPAFLRLLPFAFLVAGFVVLACAFATDKACDRKPFLPQIPQVAR